LAIADVRFVRSHGLKLITESLEKGIKDRFKRVVEHMRHTRANEADPMLVQDVKVLSAAMVGVAFFAQVTGNGEWLRWPKLRQRTRRSLIKIEGRSEAAN
jgi:hypothetical protein